MQHTPIVTKKCGRGFIASCLFKPKGDPRKPLDYDQYGETEQIAIEKMKAVLTSQGIDELEEIKTFL